MALTKNQRVLILCVGVLYCCVLLSCASCFVPFQRRESIENYAGLQVSFAEPAEVVSYLNTDNSFTQFLRDCNEAECVARASGITVSDAASTSVNTWLGIQPYQKKFSDAFKSSLLSFSKEEKDAITALITNAPHLLEHSWSFAKVDSKLDFGQNFVLGKYYYLSTTYLKSIVDDSDSGVEELTRLLILSLIPQDRKKWNKLFTDNLSFILASGVDFKRAVPYHYTTREDLRWLLRDTEANTLHWIGRVIDAGKLVTKAFVVSKKGKGYQLGSQVDIQEFYDKFGSESIWHPSEILANTPAVLLPDDPENNAAAAANDE